MQTPQGTGRHGVWSGNQDTPESALGCSRKTGHRVVPGSPPEEGDFGVTYVPWRVVSVPGAARVSLD